MKHQFAPPQVSGLLPQPSSSQAQVSGFSPQPSNDDVLVRVENVSKKFCRDLKKSLWYGLKDLGGELLCRSRITSEELRPAEFWAVKEVTFELKRGECLGLIGRNGAGKTTLLRILNGLIKPDKGRIEMRGRVGALIALGAGFNPILTGRENIYVNAAVLGLSKKETDAKLDEIVDFAELWEFIDTPVQSYSSGMQVRLGFAVAAHLEPEVLLIDEVLAVGDMGFRSKCYNRISELLRNCAVIFVSHYMPHVAKLCKNVMVLNQGEIVCLDKAIIGIDKYNDLFGDHHTKVLGLNEAQISNLKFLNKHNSISGEFNYGESIQIFFDATVSRKYKEYEISITFMNQEASLISQCHSGYSSVKIINNSKTQSIRAVIDRLILNTGTYYVNIIIYDETNTKYLSWHHAAAKIKVKGSFHGGAPVQFQAIWDIWENNFPDTSRNTP